MFHHIRQKAALVLAGVVLTACSTDRSGAAIEPTAPSAKLTLPGGDAAELREQERVERERVRVARQESAPAFQALWEGWRSERTELKQGSPVLVCAPQRFDADVRVVGPEGGVLRAGSHTLTIPRGALARPTLITMEAPVSAAAEVRFYPHGLQFERPASLVVDYKKCVLPEDVEKGVAYVDGEMNVLEWVPAEDGKRGEIVADIWHFSRYTLAKRSNYAVSW